MESQRSWSAEDITSLFDKLKLDCEEGEISEERYNTLAEDLKKPYHSYEEEDDILSRCESMVHDYKKRGCDMPKKEFDAMISTITNYVNNSSILMSAMHVSLVEMMDDIESATFARVLEEEGKLVGCTWRGLLDSVDELNRRVVPADVDGIGDGGGQCFICMEHLAKEGAVARMTDCAYSCHSRCLLQWHAENAACPNFCGFELQRVEMEDDEEEEADPEEEEKKGETESEVGEEGREGEVEEDYEEEAEVDEEEEEEYNYEVVNEDYYVEVQEKEEHGVVVEEIVLEEDYEFEGAGGGERGEDAEEDGELGQENRSRRRL